MDPISYQPNIEVENSDLEVDMDEVIEKQWEMDNPRTIGKKFKKRPH